MNKITQSIAKDISVILCGLIVAALFLPFASLTVSVSTPLTLGVGVETPALSGFTFVFGDGVLGILFLLMPVLMIALSFFPQIQAYRKIIDFGASLLGEILLLFIPGHFWRSESADHGTGTVETNIASAYKIGFYVVLILFILLIAVAVIRLFHLKGNKVFDALNETTGSEEATEVLSEGSSVNSFEKNTPPAAKRPKKFSEKEKSSQRTKQLNPDEAETPPPAPDIQSRLKTEEETATQAAAPSSPGDKEAAEKQVAVPPPSIALERENSEFIMEQLNKLFEMKEKGILTEEEFAEKKAKLLEKM